MTDNQPLNPAADRALCEAATPGPWRLGDTEHNSMGYQQEISGGDPEDTIGWIECYEGNAANFNLILVARTILPRYIDAYETHVGTINHLLEENERLQERVEELEAENAALIEQVGAELALACTDYLALKMELDDAHEQLLDADADGQVKTGLALHLLDQVRNHKPRLGLEPIRRVESLRNRLVDSEAELARERVKNETLWADNQSAINEIGCVASILHGIKITEGGCLSSLAKKTMRELAEKSDAIDRAGQMIAGLMEERDWWRWYQESETQWAGHYHAALQAIQSVATAGTHIDTVLGIATEALEGEATEPKACSDNENL
jgi:hypothetical protein